MDDWSAEELEQVLDSMGLDKRCVYDALFEICCCGGRKAYQLGTKHSDAGGNVVQGGNKLWDHPGVAYLKQFELVESSATGSGENRVYSYKLTDGAKEVGGQISQRRINEQQSVIKEILSDYSDEFLQIVLIGGTQYGRWKSGDTESVTIPVKNFASFRDEPWVAALSSELRSMETRHISEFASREDLEMLVESDSKKEDTIDITTKYHEELARNFGGIFSMLLLKIPAFHEQTLSLFERLEEVGLAFPDRVYTTSGKSCTAYWRAPYELTFLINSSPLEEVIAEFSALYPFLKSIGGSRASLYTKQEFESDVKRVEYVNGSTSIESIRNRLTDLHEEGLTSKLNDASKGSRPAFLMLDEERFENYLQQEIESIVAPMLNE
ncbi:hypothetical protein SAMN04487949_3490 [Halogranum gelatinilyticum]|uniref:Uncharacterized protein n=1 Tax=Halogranum gelatinilyticum TaxID=660521 RepID=A0A1G9Z0D6_9EURY|nr:hypothetical protein [Halogranum gelatinilyticum]SDN14838.1 hypothetical protein SAMN04487949_3490 [Halogranum gelatinilyticum]